MVDTKMSTTVGNIRITPLDAPIGAWMDGINLASPLSIPKVRQINQALLQYKMILFDHQELNESQIIQFGRYLGAPYNHPFVANRGIIRPVSEIINKEGSTPNSADWHTDVSFVAKPPRLGFLHCEINPTDGGETQFMDTELCWEALPVALTNLLTGRSAFHDFAKERELTLSIIGKEALEFNHARTPGCFHPASRQHPITGRRSLYVNHAHTTYFRDMPRDESDSLLTELYGWIEKKELQVQINLRPQQAVLWDQRNTLHRGLPDYGRKARLLRRLGIGFDLPA